jgi:hypothetical protein
MAVFAIPSAANTTMRARRASPDRIDDDTALGGCLARRLSCMAGSG